MVSGKAAAKLPTAPHQPRLFDEIRALHGLGIRREETKRFLHVVLSMFLKGRMPGQRQPLEHARGAVGQLPSKA